MDTRPLAVRRAGGLVMVPRLVIAAMLWLVIGAALPCPGGWVVLAVLALGIGACLTQESLMVRLVWWARTPRAPLPSPGGAIVLVTRRLAGVAIAGRRFLVIPEAWASRADLPVLLADARRRQLVAAGRWDLAYRFVATPWLFVAEFATGFARGLAVLPLVGFAWKLRPVVTIIAIVQAAQTDRWASAVIIAVVIGLTYLLPWTLRHEAFVVDRAAGRPGHPGPRRRPHRRWRWRPPRRAAARQSLSPSTTSTSRRPTWFAITTALPPSRGWARLIPRDIARHGARRLVREAEARFIPAISAGRSRCCSA